VALLLLAAPLMSLALQSSGARANVDQGAVHLLRTADSAFDRYADGKSRSYGAVPAQAHVAHQGDRSEALRLLLSEARRW
jgi:hypothetical protein